MRPKISVIIPVYNSADSLKKTLISMKNQSLQDFEVIVVDDCSHDSSAEVAESFSYKAIINEENMGPAVSRNKGIKASEADIVAFIDSDCIADKDWLSNICKVFQNKEIESVMGRTQIPKSNLLGDAVACLGFPGGANAGFENIWHVDKKGFTDHITSCNFAARRKTFMKFGMFDESFPLAGGEDPELSCRWTEKGVKIKYCPDILIYHEPVRNLNQFIKWMIYRGRGNYYFKKKVKNVGDFVKLRIWSSKNILIKYFRDPKIFFIFPLLLLTFVLQQWGYILESYNSKSDK